MEADPKESGGSGFCQSHDGYFRMSFLIPASKSITSGVILFLVDKSGSMAGGPMRQVNKALRYIATQQAAGGLSTTSVCIAYSDKTSEVPLTPAIELVGTGGTSFSAALLHAQNYIQNKVKAGTNVNIVFMTDGQDTDSAINLQRGLEVFRIFSRNCSRTVTVHTIGFGESHDRTTLEKLRSLGTTPGVARYASESSDLDVKFGEMFDFLSTSHTVQVSGVGPDTLTLEAEADEDGNLSVDQCIQMRNIEMGMVHSPLPAYEGPITISVILGAGGLSNAFKIPLTQKKPDSLFCLHVLDKREIVSSTDLDKAQAHLEEVRRRKEPGANKHHRVEVMTLAQALQEKFDLFHQVFGDMARGGVSVASIGARLNDLRYHAKLSKARQRRKMNERASKNSTLFKKVENMLLALPPVNMNEVRALMEQLPSNGTCPLSQEDLVDVMSDPARSNVMVALVTVNRPEHAVDAPSQIVLTKPPTVGTYAYTAVDDAMAFAIAASGSDEALGGYSSNAQKPFNNLHNQPSNNNDKEVQQQEEHPEKKESKGLFHAADGTFPNACLPLYICPDHWKRVEAQLPALLGSFFTLEPLGFHENQVFALFAVLGSLAVQRATGQWAISDWSNWLMNDLVQVCTQLKPRVLKFLASGAYAHGSLRQDPVIAFIQRDTGAGRTREVLPNLLILIGWFTTCTLEDEQVTLEQRKRTLSILLEEGWRRSWTAHLKALPPMIRDDMLASLVYKSPLQQGHDAPQENVIVVDEMYEAQDQEFYDWARFKLGVMSKGEAKQHEGAFYEDYIPPVKRNDDAAADINKQESPVPEELEPIAYDAAIHDNLVKTFHSTIAGRVRWIEKYLASVSPQVANVEEEENSNDGQERWATMIRALAFQNDDEGMAKLGPAIDTIQQAVKIVGTTLVADWHSTRVRKSTEDAKTEREKRATLIHVTHMVNASDIWVFVGRLMAATSGRGRGGKEFELLARLLANAPKGTTPLLETKIGIIMRGKYTDSSSTEHVVLSGGLAWTTCPPDLVDLFRQILGDNSFSALEISMYGNIGWVYRSSDIPNRHGHCNSTPNPKLSGGSFRGFHRGR